MGDENAVAKDVSVMLGRSTVMEGKLTFSGDARIAGRVSGEIVAKGHLRLERGAQVEAQIACDAVTVEGELVGSIRASDLVELKAGGRVKGGIETPALQLEAGAVFDGACRMDGSDASGRAKPAESGRK